MTLDLSKVPPGLVSLSKKASVSLAKNGLADQRAAVYLVLDKSGSMDPFYRNGSVQKLAEQSLGLSANLDDDGTVPVIYFHSTALPPVDVELSAYQGVIARTSAAAGWGGTNYSNAINSVVRHYQESGAADPALVIFQSDGDPQDRAAAEKAIKEASSLPIFWAFVGFGAKEFLGFLRKLDDLKVGGFGGRKVDNASFYHAENPFATSDEDLYDGITHEFAGWLTAARSKGIIR
jgi:uncharacterized protein YegL